MLSAAFGLTARRVLSALLGPQQPRVVVGVVVPVAGFSFIREEPAG